jgi:hypothetical protein
MTKISELKQRWMADEEFRQAYEEADQEYRLVENLIRARERAGLEEQQAVNLDDLQRAGKG